jgi:hypothetical protein
MWDFLSDPQNQQTLSWLGGGLAVVCGGLWALLRFVLERRSRGGSPATETVPGAPPILAPGRDLRIDRRSGVPPVQLLLIVLALVGALVFAVSQAGNKVSVTNGVGVGGNVEGSTITSQ